MGVPARIGVPSPRLLSALAAGCVTIGLLSGLSPTYGLLAAAGLLFAITTITNVTLGYALFVVASFLDVLSGNSSFSATKVIGLVVFGSWLARTAAPASGDRGSFVAENHGLTVALAALLGWAALSFAWAASASTALGGAMQYALEMLLIPIAYSAIRTRRDVVVILGAFVFGAAISAVYGLVHPISTTGLDAGRVTGLVGESNGEATVLAAAIPMLGSMVGVIGNSARLKLLALATGVILLIGLFGTLSREGLLALAAALVAAVVFGGRWRKQALVAFVVVAAATAGYFLVLAPATSLQRVTLSDTYGRSSLWKIAGRVISDHPLLGVGNDNFIVVERQYINQAGAIEATYVVTTPKLAHNTFLETAADLGIPGLLALLAVLGGCIAAAVRAAWLFERLGDSQMELIARSLVLSLAAVLTSAFFVSGQYAKYMWIPLALCPVLLGLARREAGRTGVSTGARAVESA